MASLLKRWPRTAAVSLVLGGVALAQTGSDSTAGLDRLNRLIPLLEAGRPIFGGAIPPNSPSAVRRARTSGWDFVWLEMEHSGFEPSELEKAMALLLDRRQILEQGGPQPPVVPLVRIPANGREMNQWMVKHVLDQGFFGILFPHISMLGLQKSLQYLLSRRAIRDQGLSPSPLPLVRVGPSAGEVRRNQGYVKQVLDYGVYGVIVPHLDNPEHALELVRAARYPQPKDSPRFEPAGLRGTAPGNAQAYWGIPEFERYWERAGIWPLDPEGEMLAVPIIEDAAGVAAIDDILREAKGLSAVLIGPADLSVSLGYPGQPDHPEVRQAIDRVAAACREAAVAFGITTDRDRVEDHVRAGYQFLITSDPVAIERGRRAGGR